MREVSGLVYNSDWRRCLLNEGPRSVHKRICVPGEGSFSASVMLVGEGPGAKEETQARPFVGDAGRVLDNGLEAVGLRRRGVFIANVVRCRPPGNRAPKPAEVKACRIYLVRELARVKPKIIVALGGSALKALTGQSKIADNRGKLLPLLPEYRYKCKVIPTYHPAAGAHQPHRREAIREALEKDLSIARRLTSPTESDSVRIVLGDQDDDAAVSGVLRKLSRAPVLACDLEWSVLESNGMWPWSKRPSGTPEITAIGLAGEVSGKTLAVSLPSGHGALPAALRLIATKPTVYHSAIADVTWLLGRGHAVGEVRDDTLILAGLLRLDTSLSLKALATLHANAPPDWAEEASDVIGKVPTTPDGWRRLLLYNARDCIGTLMLRKALYKMLVKAGRQKVLKLYKHVLLPATVTLSRAGLHGAPMDERLLEEVMRKTQRQYAKMIEEIGDELQLPGNYEVILGSDTKLGPILEERLGIDLPLTKKTGRPSVAIDGLEKLDNPPPVIQKLVRKAHAKKLQTTYFIPWHQMMEWQGDARLHGVYRLATARSGRTSISGDIGATFQQFSRKRLVRRMVRARKGWGIASADLSQIELRIAAWFANETTMLNLFNEDADLHRATAGWIKALAAGWSLQRFQVDDAGWLDGVTSQERFGAKAYNFGLLYGGSFQVVIDAARREYKLVLTEKEAKLGHRAYFRLYPKLKPWHESCWRFVEQGYCETPLGRIRDLGNLDNETPTGKLRKAINTPVQGTASDLALFCTVYLDELLRAEYGEHMDEVLELFGFFHDAAEIHFRLSEEEALKQIIKIAFEHPPLDRLGIELPIPLKVETNIGPTWAEE